MFVENRTYAKLVMLLSVHVGCRYSARLHVSFNIDSETMDTALLHHQHGVLRSLSLSASPENIKAADISRIPDTNIPTPLAEKDIILSWTP